MPRQFKIVPKPRKTQLSVMRDKVNAKIVELETAKGGFFAHSGTVLILSEKQKALQWVLREVLK